MNDFLNLMVPEDNNTTKRLSPISTLVFMDLETTGLPYDVGKKNVHITELSLVAIDRANFENDSTLRVINKLSLCVRPRAAISFGAINVTGLYNDMLENQKEFDESIPKLFDLFFHRLRSPVCLLAHNGKKFDFPLLQAEFKRLNFSLDREILCADTLEALRNIDLGSPACIPSLHENGESEAKLKSHSMSNQSTQTDLYDRKHTHSLTDKEIERLLSLDIEYFENIEDPCTSKHEFSNARMFESMNGNDIFQPQPNNKKLSFLNQSLTVHVNECTPIKDLNSSNLNDKQLQKTGDNAILIPKNEHKPKCVSHMRTDTVPAKRKLLFYDEAPPKKPKENIPAKHVTTARHLGNNGRKMQFSLEKLYLHFFGVNPPESHHAEADCVTLSKICQKVRKSFLGWLDENSEAFPDTTAMW